MRTSAIVGRDTDLEAIEQHLASNHLVTVLGLGGIGKTSVARALAERTPQPVAWVDLAAVAAESDVAAAILRALDSPSIDAWALTNAASHPLVVLDNCEHVLAGATAVVADIHDAHDNARILATSRVELGVGGEIRYRLPPLPVVTAGESLAPAVELFLTRSKDGGAAWPDSPANTAAAEAIVAQLDGIPLAIELAAAQALAIAPVELAGLMELSLEVLTNRNDPGGHHNSLRAVVAATYERLSDEAKQFFWTLAPVGVPFDLDIAAAVAETDPLATLDQVNGLLRESLLVAEHGDDGTSRFRLLEPIREFALDQLIAKGDVARIEDRFIQAMTDVAIDVVTTVIETFDFGAITRVTGQFDHIVRAIELAISRDETPDRAFQLVLPLFAPSSGPRTEVAALGLRIHDRWLDTPAPLRAEALAVIAHSAMNVGQDQDALRLAQLARDDPGATALGRLIACRTIGSVAAFADDYETAEQHYEQALTESGALNGVFHNDLSATVLGFRVDDLQSVEPLVALADTAAADEDYVSLGWILTALSNIYVHNGQLTEASRCVDRAELVADRSPLRWSRSSIARSRSIVESAGGDWAAAASSWRRCIDLLVGWGDAEGIGACIRTAAASAEACNESEIADQLWLARPLGRSNTILPRPFIDEEQRIEDRCGTPLPVGLAEAVERTRSILGQTDDAVEDHALSLEPRQLIRFAPDYEIDLDRHELRGAGERIHVEPQVFDLLVYLASNTGRVVSREELMDEVWGTRFVTGAAVSSRVGSARKATGDDGKRQAVIRTAHGRGFEFVAELLPPPGP